MAMIKCPECGQEISDKAKKCVHCGKILINDTPVTRVCIECGEENPIDATECIHCGCPFEKEEITEEHDEKKETNSITTPIKKKNKLNRFIFPIMIIGIVALAAFLFTVIIPKNTYNNAITLLENGKYEEADKKLKLVRKYKDAAKIREQIKWESRVYECITELKQYLKNPDSLQIYDVQFYYGYKPDITDKKKKALDSMVELTNNQPVCVMRRSGQNGFGGNTTGYSLFIYKDGSYQYTGSCSTLDESKIKDSDEKTFCQVINVYKDNLEQVGDVDLNRIKTLIKNDSYSTIKIIE